MLLFPFRGAGACGTTYKAPIHKQNASPDIFALQFLQHHGKEVLTVICTCKMIHRTLGTVTVVESEKRSGPNLLAKNAVNQPNSCVHVPWKCRTLTLLLQIRRDAIAAASIPTAGEESIAAAEGQVSGLDTTGGRVRCFLCVGIN